MKGQDGGEGGGRRRLSLTLNTGVTIPITYRDADLERALSGQWEALCAAPACSWEGSSGRQNNEWLGAGT